MLPFTVEQVWLLIGAWLLICGLIGFIMIGADWKAFWLNLLVVALLGGFWGIFVGSRAFHRTPSGPFMEAVYVCSAGLWIVILSKAVSLFGAPITF